MALTGLKIKPSPAHLITTARAYFQTLKGLCLLHWTELGKADGAALVGILREKWDTDLKAANGTAAQAQRKALAQGVELANLQDAHYKTRVQLRLVNKERDELKALLLWAAPLEHDRWLRAKKVLATDNPQTHETHGD